MDCGELDDAELCERTDRLAERLWPHAVQLFLWETYPAGEPDPLGSGVLVRTGCEVFIFSAAHVLAAFKNTGVWVGVGDYCFPLQGKCIRVTGNLIMGDHQKDSLDAAVGLLLPDSPDELTTRAFDISTNEPFSDPGNSRYLLFVQPANRTEVDVQRSEIRSQRKPLIYSEVPDAVYTKMGYDKRNHLLFQWHKQWKTATGSHGAWKLNGSSGGAIWRFDPYRDDVADLAAIFTEFTSRKSGGRVVVGTRTHVHLDLARQCIE